MKRKKNRTISHSSSMVMTCFVFKKKDKFVIIDEKTKLKRKKESCKSINEYDQENAKP